MHAPLVIGLFCPLLEVELTRKFHKESGKKDTPSSSCVREFGSSMRSLCISPEISKPMPRVHWKRNMSAIYTVWEDRRSAVCRATGECRHGLDYG